jgi:hypothetical protein
MRLAGASEEVRSLLALTALDRVFPMYETVEEALAAPQLSMISVPPGDVSPATEALKTGMKMAGAAIGAAAIANLIMMDGSDDALPIGGDEDDVSDDDDEYDDDIEDDDEIVEDEDTEETKEDDDETTDDELDEAIDDDDIEEIEEDDLIEAEDLDLEEEDDDEDDDLF